MADRAGLARRPLVGRAGEIDAVTELLRAAALGEAGALLISGEAGVGKTALAREVMTRAGGEADVLWAPCLPLTSLAVPFLPLATALRGWAADRDVPVPVLGGSGDEGPAGFDVWLDEVCRQRPVVLVVDDLQWADQSSLDVLMYVLAGLPARRFAVVTTVRAGEEGGPLRRWLADVRRFPGVTELALSRLDRVAVGEQIAGLLGSPPHQSLIDDVYTRTQGNAYLTMLLVRGLSPEARSLPVGLPTDLREAAARAWHGLSPHTRELSRLIAVAGRPQHADDLVEVAATTGVGGGVVPSLREAVDAGVLEVHTDDTYWFVHPLLAEVLEQGLLPEERRTAHAAFASIFEPSADPAELSVEAAVDLADHHHQAGHHEEAYKWALFAAETAGRAGGTTERLRLLRRALDLRAQVTDPGLSQVELLRRIQAAADQAGDPEEELAVIEELLVSIDGGQHPLLVAELLVRRMLLRLSTGREFAGLADVREAVRLSADYPGSAEYALAMAELAHAELRHDEPGGPAHAEEAVRLARACGSAKALAYALTANVMKRLIADETGSLPEAEEAQAAAAEASDFWAFGHATLWAGNCLDISPANRDVIECLRRGREEMLALGAPHTYVARMAATEASGLLQLGDWRGCQERLRIVLRSAPGPMPDADVRLTAALLSCRQGRRAEAEAHMARAEEVFAEQSGFLAFAFDAVRAELAVATGETDRAMEAALTGVSQDTPPTMVERLIPLAARAAADDIQALRDRGEDPATAAARLDGLRSQYPKVVLETGQFGPTYTAQARAMQAWYDAEVLRGKDDPGVATAWQHAAKACADAELAWDEAYARWRVAEALSRDRRNRDEAAAAMRRAHQLAVDLQAAPLLTEIEALAQSSRVSLEAIDVSTPVETAALPGLTAREREILAHIVAGRTYGEIARELVLSEKTVSVHVSNLLRKTGAKNRVELAQLARRVSVASEAYR